MFPAYFQHISATVKFPPCARYITAAVATFVLLSGMSLTGGIMQIYEDGNRSFEGCQLDLGTPAMTAFNENLLCWQACAHVDDARM